MAERCKQVPVIDNFCAAGMFWFPAFPVALPVSRIWRFAFIRLD
jgi:hypothetical protein